MYIYTYIVYICIHVGHFSYKSGTWKCLKLETRNKKVKVYNLTFRIHYF